MFGCESGLWAYLRRSAKRTAPASPVTDPGCGLACSSSTLSNRAKVVGEGEWMEAAVAMPSRRTKSCTRSSGMRRETGGCSAQPGAAGRCDHVGAHGAVVTGQAAPTLTTSATSPP